MAHAKNESKYAARVAIKEPPALIGSGFLLRPNFKARLSIEGMNCSC